MKFMVEMHFAHHVFDIFLLEAVVVAHLTEDLSMFYNLYEPLQGDENQFIKSRVFWI